MSLTNALSVASSGMSTTSRWAENVSANIANADNPNYARRDLSVTTNVQGTPTVSVVARAVDTSLDAMYRVELSRTATQDAMATGLSAYTSVLGDSESTDTLLTRLTEFQSTLGLLSVTPGDAVTQRSAVTDAQDLALALNRAGEALADASDQAEAAIAADVASVNASLERLQALNERLVGGIEGDARLALEDEVAAELDGLAEVIDFTLRSDAQGRVELYATGGAELLAGNVAHPLSYEASTGILRAGAVEITPGKAGVRGISEGSLAGQITLVTETLPEMQAQLDAVARALIETTTAADPTLADGAPGLFTDAGEALDDPFAPGLATRIAVNEAVLPEAGGAYWRIRDGMGAVEQGTAGDNSLVEALGAALSGTTSFDEAAGLGGSDTLSGYVSALIASQNTTRASAESAAQSYAAGAMTVQSTRMAFSGINLDDELQQLTAIQQSYSANARVLTIASEMIDTLLGAT